MELINLYKNLRIGKVSALILAGGVGSRMGSETPKQHLLLGDTPVIVHTMLAFQNTPCIHEIIVAIRPNEEALYDEYRKKYGIDKLTKTVVGGATRSESAFKAMEAVDPAADLIAVHDGARCLVTRDMIERVAFAAVKYKAASAACAVTDTVALVDAGGTTKTEGQPARSSLMALQTPQIFDANLYRAISYTAKSEGFSGTDDTSLAHYCGFSCQTVDTGKSNLKITAKEDLDIAMLLLSKREEKL